MKINVGTADRIARGLAGAGLVGWAILGGPVWAWIGLVPLATAAFSFCPLYAALRLSTAAPEGTPPGTPHATPKM